MFLARRSTVRGWRLLARGWRGWRGDHEDLLRFTIYISLPTLEMTDLGPGWAGVFVAELHLAVVVCWPRAGGRIVGGLQAGGQRLLWRLVPVRHTWLSWLPWAGYEVGEGGLSDGTLVD